MRAIFYSHQEVKLCVLKCLWSGLWTSAGRADTIVVGQRSQPWCGVESDQKAEELASARNCLPNAVCVHLACPFADRRGSTSCPGMKIPDKPPPPVPSGSVCLAAGLPPLTPVMIPNPKVIFLFLWLLQCAGGNVDVLQKPPIQVALLKEEISIPCEVVFPYMPKYTKFSISYYWINSLDQKTFICSRVENIVIPSGKENKTAALSYDHKIMPLENTSSTGTYYCEVQWNDIKKMGKGVFVLIRDTGYINTSYSWEILVTLTVLLAVLSITATALLLWKRKVLCPRRNRPNILRQKVETQLPSASPPPLPPPVYDSLNVQQVDVYSSLENNTNNPSHRKNPPEKTPKKQETLEESSDTLYENI
ncbi:LOW QUALITY PROTEIN: NFAT activation molecule 1 [Melozone crissalis]|uniref:LOW QUALITY PROTEIN: NFAT activation molecule 1 n=1 Tax=Melozone crissalis TaxID=40204 RepID=UPI0023DABD63|nr:LOW QUALITY PROTEIN: NFAT activation molecule 1 [Melozone crissalis]